MYDAVVVGGGIVGASVAYHLAEAGTETLLSDRSDEGRATAAGAGIVSPATSSRTESEPWFRLAVAAADYYPDLADRLTDETGGDVGYDRPGILSVAEAPAAVDAFEAALARTRERQRRLGHPEPGSVEERSPEAARERFPPLGPVERAFAYENAARVDGRRFADALWTAGRDHGLDVVRASAEELLVEDGAVAGVRTDQGEYAAAAAVIAGGAWSSDWNRQLGLDVPVEPRRGQIVHLDARTDTADWPMIGGYRGHYLVPWPDGRVAAGATRETGSGFDPRATVGGVRSVLDEALRVAPGLDAATFGAVRVGLRPASADGLPLLGQAGVDGAYLATGHGPTGLTLGPYSGKVVADLVRGEVPPVDLAPFEPSRF
jgi:D-amino-acid dehydrogenase